MPKAIIRISKFASLLCILLLGVGVSQAAPINPLPLEYGPDTGTKYFLPSTLAVSVEVYDLGDILGSGSVFGFYFKSDPLTPIPIFTATDDVVSAGALALIDFLSGVVYDLDAGSAVVTTFSGSGEIGFFLGAPSLPLISTDPANNPGGLDLASVFPSLTLPSAYLLGFDIPDAAGASIPLAFEVVGGIAAVPEPGTMSLFGIAAIALGAVARRRKLSLS